MNRAVIGLGSNINPAENIQKAKTLLAGELTVLKESLPVVTKPIKVTNQPDFLNGAILVETLYTEKRLKSRLTAIEDILGRKREGDPFGPRTIDLDLLVWNQKVVSRDVLERDFVKNAVKELLPDFKISANLENGGKIS